MYAVVGAKHQYFPAPHYRSYFKEYKSRNLLRASIEDYIAQLQDQVVEQENEMREFRAHLQTENARVKDTLKLISEEERKIQTVRQSMMRKNTQIETIRNE